MHTFSCTSQSYWFESFAESLYMSQTNACWEVLTPIRRPVVSRINEEVLIPIRRPVVTRINEKYYVHERAAKKPPEDPICDAFSRAVNPNDDNQVTVQFPVLQEQRRNRSKIQKEKKKMMETQNELKSEWRNLLFHSTMRKVETGVFGVACRWMSSGSTKVRHWPKQRHREGLAHGSNESNA